MPPLTNQPTDDNKILAESAKKEEEIITANRRLIELMEREIEKVIGNIMQTSQGQKIRSRN